MGKIYSDFTIGITTCYGGKQLLKTVQSIRQSSHVGNFKIIIIADSTPISEKMKASFSKLGINLIENPHPSSILAKQQQILQLVKTKYLIFTHDDVIFEPDTIVKVIHQLQTNPKVTFVGVKNKPLPSKNFIEKSINIGTHINNQVAKTWNHGDNYLAIVGRLMAFKTNWLKHKMRLSNSIVSLDAYLYFENKRCGGEYQCVWDANLYFRNPQNLSEHLKKSSRFQNSYFEMKGYHKFSNLESEYHIPLKLKLLFTLDQLVKKPIETIFYLLIYIFTRFRKINPVHSLDPIWSIDISTKNLY